MKHDPLEKLRTVVTFLLLDLPERHIIITALKRFAVLVATGLWIYLSIQLFK